MTATGTGQSAQATGSDQLTIYPDEMKGSGWLFFAGTILGLAGLMRIIDAFWAFRYKGALPEGLQNGLFGSNLKHYAWVWLAVGIILIVSSFLILARSQVARWVGYIAAVIGGLSAMTWMPYYPIWSITYVGIAVLVFYALARYGGPETT
ncbi:MAG TPA: hypothetical protein VMT43_01100 [Acidimicrobiales bacterium]|nr:hypothetical protein [Acidimicrobiales bacterium]